MQKEPTKADISIEAKNSLRKAGFEKFQKMVSNNKIDLSGAIIFRVKILSVVEYSGQFSTTGYLGWTQNFRFEKFVLKSKKRSKHQIFDFSEVHNFLWKEWA